ncbi:MAG: hypothetical protein HZB56_17865 [Deltaproteobacteria bacterium]|nr:hypothetical protein [Deltaproteobacteria bacterium]
MFRIPLALAVLALAACSPDFDPASRVEKLRLLAVRADPPEIEPPSATAAAPDRAALTALVLRGDLSARPATVLYVACLPGPDSSPTPCTTLATLRDPAALAVEATRAACPGAAVAPVVFAGAEVCSAGACGPARATLDGTVVDFPPPALALPPGYGFGGLPRGSPERALGTFAPVLAFAVDAAPDELAGAAPGGCPAARLGAGLARLWGEREHVLAEKRVHVRGPEAPDAPNRNPAVAGIAASGAALGEAPPSPLGAGRWALRPLLPPDAGALHDLETTLDASGAPVGRAPEEWVYSWFSTAGEIDVLHTREPEPDEWRLAAGDVAGGGRALVAVVVRDLRGGTAWVTREVALRP